MKKILFVYAVDYRFQHVITGVAPPVGILWLIEAIKHKYNYRLVDLSLKENLLQVIKEYSPDLIAISIRNVHTAANPPVSFMPFLKEIVNIIRKNTSVEIIFGGAGFSLYPEACLSECRVKYGIVGVGTQVFPIFLDNFFAGRSDNKLAGLATNHNGEITVGRKSSQRYPERYPVLNGEFCNKYFSAKKTNYPVQTKRGCAFNCVYCSYPTIEGHKYIKRSIDNIYNEIKTAVDIGIDEFFFSDSVFNHPVEFCLSICARIKQLGIKWTGYINPAKITNRTVEVFKKSGCQGLQVGLDTLAVKTLRSYRKNFSVQDVLHADRCFCDVDIPIYYWINLGGPGETSQTLLENIDNMRLLKPAQGYIGYGFVILPGSFLQKAYGPKNENELLAFYMSDQIEEREIVKHVDLFTARFPRWFSWLDIKRDGYLARARQIKREEDANYWCRPGFEPINQIGSNPGIKYRE